MIVENLYNNIFVFILECYFKFTCMSTVAFILSPPHPTKSPTIFSQNRNILKIVCLVPSPILVYSKTFSVKNHDFSIYIYQNPLATDDFRKKKKYCKLCPPPF